ncbi:exported hypothetical protein [Verrucomicrobia bacterium]|nr:exported hypothetical protein [Verrucomicrobiota bacterium]
MRRLILTWPIVPWGMGTFGADAAGGGAAAVSWAANARSSRLRRRGKARLAVAEVFRKLLRLDVVFMAKLYQQLECQSTEFSLY